MGFNPLARLAAVLVAIGSYVGSYFVCPGVLNGIACGRRVAQLHESKTASTVQAITNGLTKALGCRRIVFETGRLAPILFHG
jgi:hypothetical protein